MCAAGDEEPWAGFRGVVADGDEGVDSLVRSELVGIALVPWGSMPGSAMAIIA
jgi:hypothetical protein